MKDFQLQEKPLALEKEKSYFAKHESYSLFSSKLSKLKVTEKYSGSATSIYSFY